MNRRSAYMAALAVLLLGVVTVTSGVWLTGSFSHGDPSLDAGCYCHNNGIAIYVNGTGDGNGGLFFSSFAAGSSFHLYVSTNNVQATGVVPGLQQWFSNQTDNAKFAFSPASVTDGSAQDRSPTSGNITALYKITVPSGLAGGLYTLTLYAQGSEMQSILVQVTAGTTSTSSTTTTHSTTSTTSTTTSSSSSTTHSTTSTTTTTSTPSTTTSTSSTTTTHSTTSTATSPTTTTTSSTSTSVGAPYAIRVFTNAQNYSATTTIAITGFVSPAPENGTIAVLQIVNPEYTTVVYDDNLTVTAGGTFSYTFGIAANSTGWVSGLYKVTVTTQEPAPMTAIVQFSYTPHVVTTTSTSSTSATVSSFTTTVVQASTQTSTATVTTTKGSATVTATTTATATSTVTLSTATVTTGTVTTTATAPATTLTTTTTATQPPSTVTTTAPATTLTSTATLITTSTVPQTNSAIPDWAYAAMLVLLLAGLAIGYLVKKSPARPVPATS